MAAGTVTIGAPNNGALIINQQSQKAVVEWQDFSVGRSNAVSIHQPGSGSALLNRVTGTTPSTIAGTVSANGQVYLVNPNGIAITPSGSINVGGGFVASTLGITNQDFDAGRLNFNGNGVSAAVSNQGKITTASGGFVGLLGGQIANSGVIVAPVGKVGIGAGEQATLDLNGNGFLQVVTPTDATGRKGPLIDVTGRIVAPGGRIEIRAAAAQKAIHDVVNLPGSVSANSIHREGGVIILDGGQGTTRVTGEITATSTHATGGNVSIAGHNIILNGAKIDVSGGAGGGRSSVRAGSSQGKTGAPGAPATVVIDARSSIKADALITGNGGLVTVVSDGTTRFAGSISAQAFGPGGRGGSAEVSGAGLQYTGTTNLLAAHGTTGSLLLDPYDVTISSGTDAGTSNFSATASGATINTTTLTNALATANVTVSTGASGGETGNITVSNAFSWSANTTLTLSAAGGIIFNAGITNSGTASGLTFNASGTGGISGAGALANSGTLTLNVANAGGTGSLSGVISGAGSLVMTGAGKTTLSGTNTYTGATTISGGVLQIGGAGSLGSGGTYAGSISIASGTSLQYSSSAAQTLTGVIAGAGTVIKDTNAASVLSLTGVNTYSGGTTVNVGTLIANVSSSSSNSIGTGAASIASGAKLEMNNTGASLTIGNAFSGAGQLNLNFNNGGSDTYMNGAFGMTGQIVLSASSANNNKWDISSALGTTSASLTINTGTTLYVSGPGATIAGGINLSGSGNAEPFGAIRVDNTTLGGNITLLGNATVGTNISGGNIAGNITSGIAGNVTLTLATNSKQITLSGIISNGSGTVLFAQSQSGTTTLTGANTYTGSTTVSAGTLKIGGAGSLGSGSYAGAITVSSGGVFEYSSNAAQTLSGIISGAGQIQKDTSASSTLALTAANTYTGSTTISAGTLQVGSAGSLGAGAYAGAITVASGALLEYSSSVTQTLSGVMSGAGAITKDTATSTLTLAGTNTYSGTTAVSAGTLKAGSTSAFGTNSATTLSSAGTIDLAGYSNSIGSLAGSGGTVTDSSATAVTLTTGGNNTATSFAGIIQNGTGTLSIAHTGTATQTLSGTNTYSGTTTVSAGTLLILNTSSNSAVGTLGTGAVSIASGASLSFNNADTVNDGYLISNTISGAGSVNLLGPNGSTTTLNVANTYSGGTVISSGIVNLGANAALGAGTVTMTGGAIRATVAARTLANNFTLSGTIGVGSSTIIAGSITLAADTVITPSRNAPNGIWSGNIALGSYRLATSDTGPNTVGATWSGQSLTLSGAISGTGGVTQGSVGTLVLSGANTYSGTTIVSAGTLTLSGSLNVGASNTATTSVATGGTLNGGGVITAALLSDSGGGTVSLTGANAIGAVATSGTVGSFALNDAQSISLGSISASGAVLLIASGATSDLTLSSGSVISSTAAGNAITLAAGRNFINSAGSSAVSANSGRWLVYSAAPGADTFGALNSNATAVWNATYAGQPPANVSQTGNRYLFATQPTITFTSTNSSKIYGTDTTASVASQFSFSGLQSAVSGVYLADTQATAFPGTPNVTSAGAASSATVASGPYTITVTAGTLTSVDGYALNYSSAGSLDSKPGGADGYRQQCRQDL